MTVTLKPASGNADLAVYRGGSRTVASRVGRIGRSRHHGTKRDRVRFRNRSGKKRTAYIRVYQRGRRPANTVYGLSVRRG